MGSTATGADGQRAVVDRLGIQPGMVVQQFGDDSDIDEALVAAVRERIGGDLAPSDSDDVIDAVLLWWREDDGDLVDALVDARPQLSDSGVIWLLTPKAGREGHVEPSDVLEAVPTAGLTQTGTLSVSADWNAARLAAPKSQRAPRR